MKQTSILLAEDHRLVREAFRAILDREPGFAVVGEAGDGLEAVRMAERLKPDVLVVDWMLPALNGREVIRQVHKRLPRTRIVVVSMHANEGYVVAALRVGASAYVLKEATSDILLRAIREALAGRRYLGPPLSVPAIRAYLSKAEEEMPSSSYETLTSREREVLQLVAEGYTSTQIGARLFISRRTVESHRASLLRKLDAHSQADLIRYALQHHLVPLKAPNKAGEK